MTVDEIAAQVNAMKGRIENLYGEAARAQVCEFLRDYAGAKSSFFLGAQKALSDGFTPLTAVLSDVLDSYVEYLKAGLATGVSLERRAQMDVVSDILGQAQSLLEDSAMHPAAAAMIVGASLEEFLRTWVESEDLKIGAARPGIDAYSKALRASELLSKQDIKDITSWAGTRNDAAHGNWDEVSDRQRIRLMLEGVNLFMRKHASS